MAIRTRGRSDANDNRTAEERKEAVGRNEHVVDQMPTTTELQKKKCRRKKEAVRRYEHVVDQMPTAFVVVQKRVLVVARRSAALWVEI